MDLIIRGILFGLVLAVLLGPIFLVVINTSIQHGKKAGFIACLGVWISDFVIIILSYLFINQIKDFLLQPHIKIILGIIGGSVLITMGIINLLKRVEFDQGAFAQKISLKSFADNLMKGLLVNTVNPFTFFFWLTVMTTEVTATNLSGKQAIIYLSAIFLTIVATDSLKVILADKIRKHLTPLLFKRFIQFAGVGLVGFGLYFLVYVIFW